MALPRLYTFWISHFSEKVRWALELEGIAFEEKALLPGPHVLTIRRLAPRQEVPTLVHQGQVTQGSRAILDAVPELFKKYRLQPWSEPGRVDESLKERARELEALADDGFGKAIQAFGYDMLLADRAKVVSAWSYRGPFWARAFYALTFGKIEQALREGYCKSPEHVETSRRKFLTAFDQVDAILERQPYLLGDKLTRADIAVAALLCPVVRPQEHPLPWPEYPQPLEDFCRQLAERPTYQFAQRLYREHRVPSELRGSEHQE